jgi:UDP-N-acetylglucosamine 1-carboxyvinyltransferase
MDRFLIPGPARLAGCIRASGAKNAALPALAASLLADEPLELRRVPEVQDIRTMRKLLGYLDVESSGDSDSVTLRPLRPAEPGRPAGGRPDHDEAPYQLVKTMRASALVLGPLLARRGHARVSLPGGCAIGVRPIDLHLAGLEALGATVKIEHGYVEARAPRLLGARFRFPRRTVGGTENLMMAASLARGTTVLENCAREPEIVDLARLLRAMGAGIEGAGEERITIEGRDRLGGATHTVIPDRIEVGTYLIGAAITRGDVTVEGARPADLAPLLDKLDEIGARVEIGEERIRVRCEGAIQPCSVATEPHPGFPTDLQAQYLALLTQAEGTSTVSETVFENRFQHVPELVRMGADIRVERGSLARVHGPTPLSGAAVMATDLRASACLVLAALAAHGETRIHRIYHLDRGYERMESKLQTLGACVERIRD